MDIDRKRGGERKREDRWLPRSGTERKGVRPWLVGIKEAQQ